MAFSMLVVGQVSNPMPDFPNVRQWGYAVLRYDLENRVGKKWRWYLAGQVSPQFRSYTGSPAYLQKLPRAKPSGPPRWHQLRGFVAGVAAVNENVRALFADLDAGSEDHHRPVSVTEAGVLADALQEAGVPEGHPVLGALRSWGI